MRVIQKTSTRLTLKLTPWLMWSVGSLFLAVGALAGALIGGETILTCDRTAPAQCDLSQRRLIGAQSEQFPVAELQSARVREKRDSDGDRTYQVVLELQSDDLSFTPYSSSGASHHRAQAARINAFIADPNQLTLTVREDTRFWGLLFFVAFGGGGGLLLLSKVVVCDFDKSMGQLRLTRNGLLGHEEHQYRLQDIIQAQLQRSSGGSSRRGRNQATYRVAIVLRSGESVPLTSYYSSGRSDKQRTVEQLRQFLALSSDDAEERNDDLSLAAMGDMVGMVIGGAEKRQATIADCQAEIAADPYQVDTYRRLAMAWLTQGDREQAAQALKTGRSRLMHHGDTDKAQELDLLLQRFGLNS